MTLQREEWLRVQELAASLRGHNTYPYKRLGKIKVVGRALNLSTNLKKRWLRRSTESLPGPWPQ